MSGQWLGARRVKCHNTKIVFVVWHARTTAIIERTQAKKKKNLENFQWLLFLRRNADPCACAFSIVSFHWVHIVFVFAFFFSIPFHHFFFLRCQPVIAYGFTLKFPSSMSYPSSHHCLRSHFYTPIRFRWYGREAAFVTQSTYVYGPLSASHVSERLTQSSTMPGTSS